MKEVLITSSVLIAAIAIIRAVLKNRVSARLIYALWLIAALRLMLPFSLAQSPVSVMNAAPEAMFALVLSAEDSNAEPGSAEGVAYPAPVVVNPGPAPEPDVQRPEHDDVQSVQEPVSIGPDIDWEALMPAVWLSGSALCAVYMLIVNGSMYFRLRGVRRRIEQPGTKLPVYLADGIPSPCLFGVVRPSIYLTSASLESAERTRMVVLHEESHYRHGDHIWSLLRCVLLCAYWFDPFVWLAAWLSRRDAELACDESCVRALGSEWRVDYGRALVDLIDRSRRGTGVLHTSTTMSGSKSAIRERVTRIARAPRTRTAAVVLIIAMVGVVSACTFTGAQTTSLVTDPDEPLTNATSYARLADGSMYDVTRTHSFDYDPVTGGMVLSYADGQTVEVTLPENLTSPYVFMSDTVAAVSFVDSDGSLRVMVSRNRGEDWTEQAVASGLESGYVTFVGFSSANDGWLLWEGYYNTGNIVHETDESGNVTAYEKIEYRSMSYITSDGGGSWTETRMNRARGSVTGMAVVDGTAYIGVTGDGSMTYSYYTSSGEGYDSLFPTLISDGVSPGAEITSTLSPVISGDKVTLPYLMPDGSVVSREVEAVRGGLKVPEPINDVDGILKLPYGVNIAPATEELLSRLRGPVTFGEIEEGQTALVAFTDDSRPDVYSFRVVRLSGDITWLRPEDFSSPDSPEEASETVFYDGSDVFNFDKYTALVFGAEFDENGQSDTGLVVGMWSEARIYRLDMVDGELTATQAGLGVNVDSPTSAQSVDGLFIVDYADSATADEYTSVQTVDAANGSGTRDFVICARHDFDNFYIFALDYGSGSEQPAQGESIARIGELLAGQCVTIEADSSGRFGIIYTDREGSIHRSYVSVNRDGAVELRDLSSSPEDTLEIVSGTLAAQKYPVSYIEELEETQGLEVISSGSGEADSCALLTTPLDELTVNISFARSRADGATTYGGEGGGRYVLTPGSALAIYVKENSVNVAVGIDIDGSTKTFGLYTDSDGELCASLLTEPGDTGYGVAVTQVEDPAAYSGGYDAVNEYGDARNLLITALDFYGEVSDLEVFRTVFDESKFTFSRGETVYADAAPDRPLLIWNPVVGGIRTCEYGFSFTDSAGNRREYLIDFAAATMLAPGMINVYPA